MEAVTFNAIKEIITIWGLIGVLICPFVGPIAVQRFFKNLPGSIIGKKKTKRRKITLISINALCIYASSHAALYFGYGKRPEVVFVAILVALFSATLTQIILSRIKSKNPELAKNIRHGMWVAEEDRDLKTRLGYTVLGGGVDKRKETRKPNDVK